MDPCSQDYVTRAYPETDQSYPHSHILFHFGRHFYLPYLLLYLPKTSSVFPTKILCVFLTSRTRAACTCHLLLPDTAFIITSGDEYKLWSSTLGNFHNSPITSFILGPDIVFSVLFSIFQQPEGSRSTSRWEDRGFWTEQLQTNPWIYPLLIPNINDITAGVMPARWRLVTGFPIRRPKFDPKGDYVELVMDELALRPVSSEYIAVATCQFSCHQLICILNQPTLTLRGHAVA